LQWLAERDDVFVNRIEVTLDYTFDSLLALDEAQEFLHFHLIRRWHSKKQQVRLYRGSQEGVAGVSGGWSACTKSNRRQRDTTPAVGLEMGS